MASKVPSHFCYSAVCFLRSGQKRVRSYNSLCCIPFGCEKPPSPFPGPWLRNAPWETLRTGGGRGRWGPAAINVLVQYFVNICNIGSPIFSFCLKYKRRKKLENLLTVFCALLNARWFGRVSFLKFNFIQTTRLSFHGFHAAQRERRDRMGGAFLTPARAVYVEQSWGKISVFQAATCWNCRPQQGIVSVPPIRGCLQGEGASPVAGVPALGLNPPPSMRTQCC